MNMRYDTSNPAFAGVGSRRTPAAVLTMMEDIAERIATAGWTLRSGGARGADSAFEGGCDRVDGKKEIYIPFDNFTAGGQGLGRRVGERGVLIPPSPAEAERIARRYWDESRIAWARMRRTTRLLMIRNSCQVLGANLDSPVYAVVYWTPADDEGGTGQALRIARGLRIPCIALDSRTSVNDVVVRLQAMCSPRAA